ncbi:MAG: hypothetical protein ACLFV0_05835 [Nitriliruptoraceae bacterium]
MIDVIQLSTYDALAGRMADDAARASRRRLARGERGRGVRSLLGSLLVPRRRADDLHRAA